MKTYRGFLFVALLVLSSIVSSANATQILDFDQYDNQGASIYADAASRGTTTIEDNGNVVDPSLGLTVYYTSDALWLNNDPKPSAPIFSFSDSMDTPNDVYSTTNMGNKAARAGPGVFGGESAWIAGLTTIASILKHSGILLIGTGLIVIAAIGRKTTIK